MKSILIFFVTALFCQSQPYIKWSNSEQIIQRDDDGLTCKYFTSDLLSNNYIIAKSFTGFFVIKFNDKGNRMWE